MKVINCRSCGAVIDNHETFTCAYCGTVDEKSKRAEFQRQSEIHNQQLREQYGKEQLRKQKEMEVEFAKRTGAFHKMFCALKAFVYSVIICEILFFLANGELSLVNLELFRYWEEFDSPFMVLVVFLISWIISFFVVGSRREKRIWASIEQKFSK